MLITSTQKRKCQTYSTGRIRDYIEFFPEKLLKCRHPLGIYDIDTLEVINNAYRLFYNYNGEDNASLLQGYVSIDGYTEQNYCQSIIFINSLGEGEIVSYDFDKDDDRKSLGNKGVMRGLKNLLRQYISYMKAENRSFLKERTEPEVKDEIKRGKVILKHLNGKTLTDEEQKLIGEPLNPEQQDKFRRFMIREFDDGNLGFRMSTICSRKMIRFLNKLTGKKFGGVPENDDDIWDEFFSDVKKYHEKGVI